MEDYADISGKETMELNGIVFGRLRLCDFASFDNWAKNVFRKEKKERITEIGIASKDADLDPIIFKESLQEIAEERYSQQEMMARSDGVMQILLISARAQNSRITDADIEKRIPFDIGEDSELGEVIAFICGSKKKMIKPEKV